MREARLNDLVGQGYGGRRLQGAGAKHGSAAYPKVARPCPLKYQQQIGQGRALNENIIFFPLVSLTHQSSLFAVVAYVHTIPPFYQVD